MCASKKTMVRMSQSAGSASKRREERKRIIVQCHFPGFPAGPLFGWLLLWIRGDFWRRLLLLRVSRERFFRPKQGFLVPPPPARAPHPREEVRASLATA